MFQMSQVEFRLYEGPSIHAPSAAAVAEFSSEFMSPLPAGDVERHLTHLLPPEFRRRISLPHADLTFENAAALLANALQDLAGPCGLTVGAHRTDAGRCRIVLGYRDAQAALHALRAGLKTANAMFSVAAGGPDRTQFVAILIRRAEAVMRMRQPDFIARSLMRAASKRGIPVYPVSPGSRIWLYGQGSAGCQFFEAANHRDSLTGARLAANKFLTNQLITRLGLPGVKHGVAANASKATQIASQLNFPLVVKPIDRGKGRGVTANITTMDEVNVAFAKAVQFTTRGVLVERHVAGDDHRLAVFGGKLKWAVRRSPPRVVGDGQHTVAELIDRENRNRSDADVAAGFVSRLVVDADMLATLAKQRLKLSDRPAAASAVELRSIANTATGGTIADCSASIHPDNREMAETIARAFHMDALGIDFMTPDIAKSWREVECAVLEINATPGFSSDGRAELILLDKFPPGVDGRIPSVVLIGVDDSIVGRVANSLQVAGKRVGQTDGALTLLAGQSRFRDTGTLPERVMALLLDSSCEALVIGASPSEIEAHGFPLDRCDLALIWQRASVSEPLRRLIGGCAAEVIDGVTDENLFEKALPSIAALLGERRRASTA